MNLSTLNSSLYAQLDRLGNTDLKGEELKEEIDRSKSIVQVGGQIIDNARLVLDAHKTQLDHGIKTDLPPMLEQK